MPSPRKRKDAIAKPNNAVDEKTLEAVPTQVLATPEAYNTFIGGVELRSLRLARCEADAMRKYAGELLEPEIEERSATYECISTGFTVTHELCFNGRHGENGTVLVSIRATFQIEYESTVAISPELFEIFRRHNLPVNVWPFFREFVHTVLGRLAWPVFVLPALKVMASERPRRERVSTSGA
ncbi:MAG: hypothetical protein NTW72_15650 [Gemmatimonadetes bacterium]|nr:hypothetical protein [Gemmatimonadota bacterium]